MLVDEPERALQMDICIQAVTQLSILCYPVPGMQTLIVNLNYPRWVTQFERSEVIVWGSILSRDYSYGELAYDP